MNEIIKREKIEEECELKLKHNWNHDGVANDPIIVNQEYLEKIKKKELD